MIPGKLIELGDLFVDIENNTSLGNFFFPMTLLTIVLDFMDNLAYKLHNLLEGNL